MGPEPVIASQRVAPTGRANARPMTGSAPPDDRLREAIQKAAKCRLDCFVAEFIIGPAEGRTRWLLAMTRRVKTEDHHAQGWRSSVSVDGASDFWQTCRTSRRGGGRTDGGEEGLPSRK